MKRIAIAFGLALAASAAQATIVQTVEDPGVYTSQVPGVTTVNWNDGSCGAYTTCTGNGRILSGSASGLYASPYGISSNYLTIPFFSSSGSVSLTTPGDYNYFGLYWGSLDTYNSISFYNNGSLVGTYNGADIFPLLANGGQGDWASNRYVNFLFTAGDVFDQIILTSTNYAFESDNHAFGNIKVPEPGSLAMFAFALMGLGFATRRRQTSR